MTTKKNVRVVQFTCDVCNDSYLALPTDEAPHGIYIKELFQIGGFGGDGESDLFVCKQCLLSSNIGCVLENFMDTLIRRRNER